MRKKVARKTFSFLFSVVVILVVIITVYSAGTLQLAQERASSTVTCTNETLYRVNASTAAQSPITTKVIEDAFGQVQVPLHPERIVVLDDHVYLDPILALGIRPVGILSCAPGCNEAFRGIPSELTIGIPDVGNLAQPSLEKILQLKPDLILAHTDNKHIYPLLSAIAPTVAIDYFTVTDFKKRLRYLARILGESDRAEELLVQYGDRVQQV